MPNQTLLLTSPIKSHQNYFARFPEARSVSGDDGVKTSRTDTGYFTKVGVSLLTFTAVTASATYGAIRESDLRSFTGNFVSEPKRSVTAYFFGIPLAVAAATGSYFAEQGVRKVLDGLTNKILRDHSDTIENMGGNNNVDSDFSLADKAKLVALEIVKDTLLTYPTIVATYPAVGAAIEIARATSNPDNSSQMIAEAVSTAVTELTELAAIQALALPIISFINHGRPLTEQEEPQNPAMAPPQSNENNV